MSDDFEPACRRMEWLDPFYKQVWEKAFAEGIPISGTFELTPRCNFNCKMCYVHLQPEEIPQNGVELTAKEWLRIAKEAKAAGTTWVCVTGGEPLLHPEFPEIWQSLTEMGFFLTLQTNASLVRGKMLDLLERCPPRQAKVTLYGTDDEVYQAVCGVEQGFTRVNEGIHNLMSLGIPVTLVSTVIRQNRDDVERMAFYAYRHGLKWLPTASVKPSLRGAGTDALSVRAGPKERGGPPPGRQVSRPQPQAGNLLQGLPPGLLGGVERHDALLQLHGRAQYPGPGPALWGGLAAAAGLRGSPGLAGRVQNLPGGKGVPAVRGLRGGGTGAGEPLPKMQANPTTLCRMER